MSLIVPPQALASDWASTSFRVGARSTQSKIEALVWANQDPAQVVFDFNDSFWKNQSWTTEPTETWQELCTQRALQIREQNKKVIMWFSGGYDSLTMAWAFVWAKTYVDEIIIYDKNWYNEGDNDYATELAYEFKQKYWPNVIINNIVITHELTNQFYKQHGDDWIYSSWFRSEFTKNSRIHAINNKTSLLKELDNPGTIMIDGFDKPRLDIFDGNWYQRMTDVQVRWFVDSPITGFFISNQLPALQIKQSWLMIKFFEQHNITTNAQVHDVQRITLWDKSVKPFSYEEYSCAPGRIAPTFWFAKEFYNKIKFNGGLRSAEALPLANRAQIDNPDIYQTYQNGLATVRKLLPDLIDSSYDMPTIMGTPFFCKKVGIKESNLPIALTQVDH